MNNKKIEKRALNIYNGHPFRKDFKADADILKIFNNRKEYIKNNTTFVTTGHNIKWYAALSMESFSVKNNVNKNQMYYFDDYSDDGSKEELEKRGFKIITWDEETYNEFINSSLKTHLDVRVNQILTATYKSINTKYVCFLDGDVFYYGNIIDYILNIICTREYEGNEQFTCWGWERTAKNGMQNVDQTFMWIDYEYLKGINIIGDKVTELEDYFNSVGWDEFYGNHDTGYMLHKKLTENKVPAVYLLTPNDPKYGYAYGTYVHLGWLSSSMRRDDTCGGWTDHLKDMQAFFKDKAFVNLAKEFNISMELLRNSYFENLYTSHSYDKKTTKGINLDEEENESITCEEKDIQLPKPTFANRKLEDVTDYDIISDCEKLDSRYIHCNSVEDNKYQTLCLSSVGFDEILKNNNLTIKEIKKTVKATLSHLTSYTGLIFYKGLINLIYKRTTPISCFGNVRFISNDNDKIICFKEEGLELNISNIEIKKIILIKPENIKPRFIIEVSSEVYCESNKGQFKMYKWIPEVGVSKPQDFIISCHIENKNSIPQIEILNIITK